MGIGAVVLALIAIVLIARYLGARKLGRMLASTNRVVGFIAIVFAVGLLVTGRWPGAIAAALFAASLVGWDLRAMLVQALFSGFTGSAAAGARWRTGRIELLLKGRSLDGRVLAGAFAGRGLSSLNAAELKALWREVADDADSRNLVEAYLDRRMPGWREDLHGDAAAREARPARPSAMTDEEAYQILGLQPGAGRAEIMQAYRRLMKTVHPDTGGSAFLAAKVNEARDKLAAKHDTRSN
jgi:hypothetical protein